MATILNPYLGFLDTARDALLFYQGVLGGEVTLNTFADYGAEGEGEGADRIMHGQLVTEAGLVLMAADTPAGEEHSPGSAISVSLSGDDEPELRGYWDGLLVGGTEIVPFEKAPWGDHFGMLTDQFGITWMVNSGGTVQ